MTLERKTRAYNDRRYGRPYIAKMVLANNKMEPIWGTWTGQNGTEGLLILDNMEPGDIYMQGQRDNRKMRNSAPNYYLLGTDGAGTIITKAEAYKLLSTQLSPEAKHYEELANYAI